MRKRWKPLEAWLLGAVKGNGCAKSLHWAIWLKLCKWVSGRELGEAGRRWATLGNLQHFGNHGPRSVQCSVEQSVTVIFSESDGPPTPPHFLLPIDPTPPSAHPPSLPPHPSPIPIPPSPPPFPPSDPPHWLPPGRQHPDKSLR